MSTYPPVVVDVSMSWSNQGASMEQAIEIDRAEWESMTPEERVEHCQEAANGWAENEVQWGWHIHDETDRTALPEEYR